ncbi:CocE/NonD family hydrolase [Mycolicibacterium pulveris]|uniref:Hydrolase n=1 Tax=Mycolicibacterium pulveris TaxID=36813 RepID=A0A7I7UCU4_MYCPV|nr:CocE/NonD family hydrolase [Mycolicibacterium pulveris]MCV6981935.1 CocE/NonD family hydrolase [Mycolicibacterium pulveris]BBY79067.1 hydrolase [Mycolicibacterium pulveris]
MTEVSSPATAKPRSKARRLAGRTAARLLRLPPHTTDFTVSRVRVPMRDGVELMADHYAPATPDPAGTLLIRCPYGRGFPFSTLYAGAYASRGYHVLFQSVRGTYGSGGEFMPMSHEIADGADTVAWLREQPWFTGTFGTIGLSYLGFTQWALLVDPPPEMKAAVITVGPHDTSGPRWGPGSFGLNDFLGWSDLVARQEDPRRVRLLIRQLNARRALARATTGLPLGESARKLLGTGAPWFEDWLAHPEPGDPYWSAMRLQQALDRAEIPVLLISGWQDLFLEQTLTQYQRLHERDVEVGLTVGSWTHTHLTTKAAPIVLRESLDWLGSHLSGRRSARPQPVRVHVNGGGWIDLPQWPPARPEVVRYLQPGGRLGDTVPPETAPPSTFTYDSADPTPTVGGRLLAPQGGYRRDDSLARRPDVVSFTGDRLPADLYVVGTPVVELAHSCDNPHNDLFVRISEVDAKGTSRNVSDGYLRGAPDSATVRIELDAVAHRFRAGSRIRVLVAGGSHPRFVRNLGTDEPVLSSRRLVPATHTVHLGDGASRLVLPAGPRPPSGD